MKTNRFFSSGIKVARVARVLGALTLCTAVLVALSAAWSYWYSPWKCQQVLSTFSNQTQTLEEQEATLEKALS